MQLQAQLLVVQLQLRLPFPRLGNSGILNAPTPLSIMLHRLYWPGLSTPDAAAIAQGGHPIVVANSTLDRAAPGLVATCVGRFACMGCTAATVVVAVTVAVAIVATNTAVAVAAATAGRLVVPSGELHAAGIVNKCISWLVVPASMSWVTAVVNRTCVLLNGQLAVLERLCAGCLIATCRCVSGQV